MPPSGRHPDGSHALRAWVTGASGLLLGKRGQRRQLLLGALAADLAAVAQPLEPGDLALALQSRGMVGGQPLDQPRDAVAQLQREVGGGGAHELAHVLDRDLPIGAEAVGVLGFAHGAPEGRRLLAGGIAGKGAIRPCAAPRIAFSAAANPPWVWTPRG